MNFDYGNILSRSVQILWKHKSFSLFLIFPMLIATGIMFVFILPVFLLNEGSDNEGIVILLWVGILALGGIISFVTSAAGFTSLVLGILRVERGEDSTSFMELVRDGFEYFGRAVGAMLIVQLSMGLFFTIFFLCVAALTAVTMGMASICLQPVMLLLTPLSFLVLAVMNGATISVIDEGLGSWEAVKRALDVVREHVWKFIILTLIIYFVTMILSGLLTVPVMIPAGMISFVAESGMDISEQIFGVVMISFICLYIPLMALFSGVSGTFMTTTLTLGYLRLGGGGNTVVYAVSESISSSETE